MKKLNFDTFKKFKVETSKKIIGGVWNSTTLDGVASGDYVSGDGQFMQYECGYEICCVECRKPNGNFGQC